MSAPIAIRVMIVDDHHGGLIGDGEDGPPGQWANPPHG